jgi:hypothetical protein
MNILIIADHDSRYTWAKALADNFEDATLYISAQKGILDCTSYMQVKYISSEIFDISLMADMDIIILGLGGGANLKFLLQFRSFFNHDGFQKRPLIITGYNGITDPVNSHALLCRIGSDIVCVNSSNDLDLFSTLLDNLNFDKKSIFLTGFVRNYKINQNNIKNKIVFFWQSDIPRAKQEKIYIKNKLQELSLIYREYQVAIKFRSQKDRRYINLFKNTNIVIAHDQIHHLLSQTFLCITIGSTVAMEAIMHNIPTAVLSDFGIKQEYGNHHFAGSGCLLSFNELIARKLPKLNSKWKEKYVFYSKVAQKELADKIIHLINFQKKSRKILPFQDLYYTNITAPFIIGKANRIIRQYKSNSFFKFLLKIFHVICPSKNYIVEIDDIYCKAQK